MTKLNLKRTSHNTPELEAVTEAIAELKAFLHEDAAPGNPEWEESLRTIMEFQDEDGSFKMIDSYEIPMDARVDYCHTPTYICTAILMKALMADETLFESGDTEILQKALEACCKIRIFGNGMEYFAQADISGFLNAYGDLCSRFTQLMKKHCSRVFVYGTLLKGEANHDYYLKGCPCKGKATVSGFNMYDIGSFPGIIAGDGIVPGELYVVDYETLQRLDYLEGEGSLYIRKSVPVTLANGERVFAWIYEYNDSVEGLEKIPVWRCQDHVWYVSYGSNMLSTRFMHYIRGGSFESGGADHEPCDDLTAPLAVRPCDIPYDMYFGNESGSWEGKGVSFLDITKPGSAKGVAYLITNEQFRHVACQENGGCPPEYNTDWYNSIIDLGIMDGCKVVTVTNDRLRKYNEPSEAYLETLRRGVRENYPEMSENDIDVYLDRGIR